MALPEGLPVLTRDSDFQTLLRVTHTEELMRKTDTADVGQARTALPVAWWQNVCGKLYARIQQLERRLDGAPIDPELAEALLAPKKEVESSVLEEGIGAQATGLQATPKKRGRGRPRKIDPEAEIAANEMLSGGHGVARINTSIIDNKNAELASIVHQMLS